jgi:undecaprenyl diphosphate synthase
MLFGSHSKSNKKTSAASQPALECLPEHVAVIMDGNGRWAKSRGMPRTMGHKQGAQSLRNILNACRSRKIRYLTIYAFSSENWKRSHEEVSDLMQLLKHYLEHELKTMHENKVRMRFIGDLSLLSDDIRNSVKNASQATAHYTDFNLTIALSYGSRQELVRSMRTLAQRVKEGDIAVEDITEEMITSTLDTAGIPEPDLLIRTGGEHRLSNFLLWQSAYTELYFTSVLWPDFDDAHFGAALEDYAKRERRYGTAE